MKKTIIPVLMDTYGLVKFWDFDTRPVSSDAYWKKSLNWFIANDCYDRQQRYRTKQSMVIITSYLDFYILLLLPLMMMM